MSLPPLFVARDPSRVQFAESNGLGGAIHLEPGNVFDLERSTVGIAVYEDVAQVTDAELTGTFASTGTWRVTVIPKVTPFGSAAADGMGEAYIEFEADADTAADTVLGLIAAAAAGATPTSLATADAWNRFRSYVSVSVGASSAKLRLTSVTKGATFDVVVTGPAAGDSYTLTTIQSVLASTMKCGLYVAIDRTKGTNGFNAQGQPYVTAVTAATPPEDIIGPVMFGDGVEPVEPGYSFREYKAGLVPIAKYGDVTAYADKAIALSNGPEPVYVRHTTVGDYVAGLASDAAGAASGATAHKWTGTPTPTDNTLYQVQIQLTGANGEQISEVIQFTAGGSTTATLIANGLRANLATKTKLAGLITGSGTATLILDGPADGREVVVTSVGPGAISFAETNENVSTHTLLSRGDKFIRPTSRVGSAPVSIPHP